MIGKYANVVRRTVCSRIRNVDWRLDAEQEAWIKIHIASQRRSLSEPLVARIAINSCNSLLRKHKNDLPQTSITEAFEGCINSLDDVILRLDMEVFLSGLSCDRRAILEYILEGGTWLDFVDMGTKFHVSKATVSRALDDLKEYLLGRMKDG